MNTIPSILQVRVLNLNAAGGSSTKLPMSSVTGSLTPGLLGR
jgi:hypothetical protein